SLYGVSRILSKRTNKEVFLGHLRVVILNMDIAKNEVDFRSVLNSIENNEFLSRRVILLVSDEPATDIINIAPDMNPLVGQYVFDMFHRKDRTPRVPSGSIGNILKELHEDGNTLIPRIIPGKKDVKVAGAAVISNYKFI